MKFNIQAGSHPAQVEITPDGNGGFIGVISHTEYGDGQITGGKQDGDELTGTVVLDGHTAKFSAKITGATITGKLTVGWFWSQDFTGIEAT